jgi:hypothetical protein
VRESGPARRALSLGPGYRNLTPIRDRGAGRRPIDAEPETGAIPSGLQSRARFTENGHDEDFPITCTYRYRRS